MSSRKTAAATSRAQINLNSQTHLFACGGAIPIVGSLGAPSEPSNTSENGGLENERTPESVTIRWDIPSASEERNPCTKLTLPLAPETDGDLHRLVKSCQPATFGRGSQDVYDESYRRALKMDPTTFYATFDPYALGIIDTVAQMLLPSVIDSPTDRAVRAELYKLNVSILRPCGKFKPHVYTPRSPSQFGSLVVCLPAEHEGGELKIRHKGEEMTFDFSTRRSDFNHAKICWAAFYSDCEHEVLEVTSGHRLTLTYNLYAVRGAGRLTGVCPMLDPTNLPVFQEMQTVLKQDPFHGQSGTFGFWCSHAYAYTHETESPLPATLKGVDAVLWEKLRALGLDPEVKPFMTINECDRRWIKEHYQDDEAEDSDLKDLWAAEVPPQWVIGTRFAVDLNYYGDEGLSAGDFYPTWSEYNEKTIYWLTRPGKPEPQLVFATYGNQPAMEISYSYAAILMTIPPKKTPGINMGAGMTTGNTTD
ncbi:hypothetical protein GQ53DRAFT_851435 [Thozetella sp. PMI_491]|nr:hypothetical protein GQ53DRAFT_851435 [Thozetella sp. PMI_491]